MTKVDIGEYVKEYAGVLGKGFVAQMAPSVLQGALVTALKDKTVKQATEWVEKNLTLWDMLDTKQQDGLRNLACRVGRLDWLTADWTIQAIRKDLPALASLYIGWRKAYNWLVRQVDIIHREVGN